MMLISSAYVMKTLIVDTACFVFILFYVFFLNFSIKVLHIICSNVADIGVCWCYCHCVGCRCTERMTFALQQLFNTPQNNLHLFKVKNGVFVVLLTTRYFYASHPPCGRGLKAVL